MAVHRRLSPIFGRFGWLSILLWATIVAGAPATVHAVSIQETLTAPDYEISSDASGTSTITWKGDAQDQQGTSGAPGCPDLPTIKAIYGLPSNVEDATVSVHIRQISWQTLPGTYKVIPVPLPACSVDGIIVAGVPSGASIVMGKDVAAYSRDAYVPGRAVTVKCVSQSRKWKMADVEFCPFRYNAVTGVLRFARTIAFDIVFHVHAMTARERRLLNDKAFDARIVSTLKNRAAAAKWYRVGRAPMPGLAAPALEAGSGATGDYVIITTSAIRAASANLAAFVSMKQAQGFSPQVVDETTWGGGTGDAAANAIRSWLAANYAAMGTKYVLFIGSPDPSSSAVPMKMVWPRRGQGSDESCPTDYYYADLTGNWDLNGNGFYGERNGDRGAGGIDLAPEVIVGRIPYYGVMADLDAILLKLINYETATGDLSWRRKGLIAAAVSNYANEDGTGWPRVDGSEWGNYCKTDIFDALGALSRRGYEKAGLSPVAAACDFALTRDNLVSQWNGGWGFLTWWGHGSDTGAYRKLWASDNGNNIPQSSEMSWQSFISTGDTPSISAGVFPLAFQCSCLNGYPEDTSNLQYALLKRGAIGSVSASRVSWYAVATWNTSLAAQVGDNASYAYYAPKKMLLEGMSLGEANHWCRRSFGSAWTDGASYMNVFDFNVYGDPSLVVESVACSATSLSFLCLAGQDAAGTQFGVWNGGAGQLSYTISGAPDWLSVAPGSGASTGGHNTHTVTCSTSLKAPGSYSGTLAVATTAPSNARLTIPCSLTVLPATPMAVTSPCGGESWAAGTKHPITWAAGLGGTVTIDLYRGGVFQCMLTTKYPNTGSVVWTVSKTVPTGNDYSVKVSWDTNRSISGTSAGLFTIPPFVLATSPASGRVWHRGTTQSITWTTNTGGNVNIDLYNGTVLDSAIAVGAPNSGVYSWPIPAGQAFGALYKIKVSVVGNPALTTTTSAFSITGTGTYVSLTNPTVNDIWHAGGTGTVRWTSDCEDGMTITLYKATKVCRVMASFAPNTGVYSWAIPATQVLGADYSVRVTCASNSALYAQSANFAITVRGVTIAALTAAPSPARPGQAVAATGISGVCECALPTDVVRIVLGMRDGFGKWAGGDPVVVFRNVPGDAAPHPWTCAGVTIKAPICPGNYYFWAYNSVAGDDDTAIAEFKARTVTLSVPPDGRWVTPLSVTTQSIIMTSPNGGEALSTGVTYTVSWSSYIGGGVNIYLYNGSKMVLQIAAGAPNNGAYSWTVPGSLAAGTLYKILIISTTNAKWAGSSAAYFTIIKGL